MQRGERQCHIGSWREMSGPGLSWGEAGLGWRCEKKQVKRVRYKVTRESKAGNSQAGPADDDCDKTGRHGRTCIAPCAPGPGPGAARWSQLLCLLAVPTWFRRLLWASTAHSCLQTGVSVCSPRLEGVPLPRPVPYHPSLSAG